MAKQGNAKVQRNGKLLFPPQSLEAAIEVRRTFESPGLLEIEFKEL